MIDIHTEQLLRLTDLPDYLESRGLGKRFSMRAVRRWVRHGCDGALLETVTIDGLLLTSFEAVQRWVEQQSRVNDTGDPPAPSRLCGAAPDAGPSPEHASSMHLLTEHRIVPTALDRVIKTLDHPESARAFAAGVLFRAGLRTPADVLQLGHEKLLAIVGLGAKSKSVVQSLWNALQRKPSASA